MLFAYPELTFISKLASDHQKPNGLTVVPPEQAAIFLESIPIEKFYGVGPATAAKLKGLDVQNGADLKRLSEEQLQRLLGKYGLLLFRFVRGGDDRPVQPSRERKSIGKEITLLEDSDDLAEMERIVRRLTEQVVERLAQLEMRALTLTLKVKWADFVQITRSVTLARSVADTEIIMNHLLPFLLAERDKDQRKVRLLGVSVSHLVSRDEIDRDEAIRMIELLEEENLHLRGEVKRLRKQLEEQTRVVVHVPATHSQTPQLALVKQDESRTTENE